MLPTAAGATFLLGGDADGDALREVVAFFTEARELGGLGDLRELGDLKD
jgi:hypothetical protein